MPIYTPKVSMRKLDELKDGILDASWFRWLLYLLTALLYFSHLGTNAIWTPNESFYAEAVREMFASGNYLEFFYNYEPRYNKPPLTYWLIASSVYIFGMSEWSIRFPIVLLAFLTNFVAAGIGRRLYGSRVGFWTFITMALSFQFVANKAYASPETPLTFFFTLTLYLFLLAWQQRKNSLSLLAFLSLGFTVLVKGYPYYVVIAAVLGFFLLLHHQGRLKAIGKDLWFFLFLPGLLLSLLVGMAWIGYMYLQDGQAFLDVLRAETLERALNKKPYTWEDPFFYPAVISWSFLPYSLAAYLALILAFKDRALRTSLAFPLAWFAAMLLIFTISSGKIPTYFIQAHPAMALLVAWFFVHEKAMPSALWKKLWKLSLWIPSVLLLAAGALMIFYLDLSFNWLQVLLVAGMLLFWLHYRTGYANFLRLLPFVAVYVPLFLFSFAVLPALEDYRPYREMGNAAIQADESRELPVYMEGRILHNLPFYAERRMIRDARLEDLLDLQQSGGQGLALVTAETFAALGSPEALWEGYVYEKTSESRFAIFVRAWLKAKAGNNEAFTYYYLVEIG
jgi:4-amino-4-deoxy-L-arabinose transferase-like glycosyltransferase